MRAHRGALAVAACAGALAAALLAVAQGQGYRCSDDAGCELLGVCDVPTGACSCHPGFTGPSCGEMDLQDVHVGGSGAQDGYAMWPVLEDVQSNASFSWGFTGALYDDETERYHAVVNVGCCRSDTCGVTVGGTMLVHLSAAAQEGPYRLEGAVAPPTTFNPHLIRAPNGTILLYFRVNDLDDQPTCFGNGTRVANSSSLDTYVDKDYLTPEDTGEKGVNMYVAWTDSFKSTSWKVSKLEVKGMGTLHISNPSVAFASNDSVLMAYRYNPHGGEHNGVAIADSFLGPFTSLVNVSNPRGGDEDPFLWRQADGSMHMLYHNGPHGYHAFSGDTGKTWGKSPTGSYAFTLDINVTSSGKGSVSVYELARRERPEIVFADDVYGGKPVLLFNGVNTHASALPANDADAASSGFSRAFSFVQAFNTD